MKMRQSLEFLFCVLVKLSSQQWFWVRYSTVINSLVLVTPYKSNITLCITFWQQ